MSARAPAGIANRQIGQALAACTSATSSGSGLRLVISQPDAVEYIQPPTFDTRVAVQITANAEWRNGATNDTAVAELLPGAALMIRSTPSSSGAIRRAMRRPKEDQSTNRVVPARGT